LFRFDLICILLIVVYHFCSVNKDYILNISNDSWDDDDDDDGDDGGSCDNDDNRAEVFGYLA